VGEAKMAWRLGVSAELQTARRYREVSEELRTVAGDDETGDRRHALLRLALDYDLLAVKMEALGPRRKANGPDVVEIM
jgi:hypothetical protein